MPTAKQIADKKYAQSEKGKLARANSWKKYSKKPEVKKRRLELKRKTYKPKMKLYENKFCVLYKKCNVCNIEKSWKEFGKNSKSKISKNYNCLQCDKIRTSTYSKNNREKLNKAHRNRLKTDRLFKLTITLRKRTGEFFRKQNFKKNSKFYEYIGCTIEYLANHLESQFKNGMSWSNHGDWEIDHKIPLCSAKNQEEVLKLSHFSNLQPLWKSENRSKGGKL